nr:hypothetical protein [Streptomyces lunaelactis]
MTLDAGEAATWYETLPAIGVEGLVVKRLDQTYRSGTRAWLKLRNRMNCIGCNSSWSLSTNVLADQRP